MDIKFKDNNKLKINSIVQLEYIESTGTQYIDTGVKNSSNIIADIDYAFTEYTSVVIFGSDDGNYYTNTFESSSSSQYDFGYAFGDTYKLGQPPIIGTKYRLHIANGLQYINTGGTNIIESTFTMSFEGNNNIYLFGLNRGGSFIAPAKAKIFGFKVYNNNNVLILNLVPAKDKNNVVCMYDTVSQQFFYNQGTGDFIAGPRVPSIMTGLPPNISLKTTTLYHKNTPNIDGLQLLNNILNYQKTHQDEIKEYYYPTTQLWQDIITEYPDILYWYNINHKFCVYICDNDDPEQCAEDFLSTVDDIQQELEEYPDLIPIIAKYPAIAYIIAEYPNIASILTEYPEIIHSIVDTGTISFLQSVGKTGYINTGVINTPTLKAQIKLNLVETNLIYGEYLDDLHNYRIFAGQNTSAGSEIYFDIYSSRLGPITIPCNSWHSWEIGNNYILDLNNNSYLLQGTVVSFVGNINMYLFGDGQFNGNIKIASCKMFDSNLILWLVPIKNNGNPCMIDLLTGTKYLNQGTGSFTYSLEPKNT